MIPDHVRIFVYTEPQDMRRSFDGLALTIRQALGEDPHGGALFCFVNRRGNRLKVLWFDRSGPCILYKRAHGVRFVRPTPATPGRHPAVRIDAGQFAKLLSGVVRSRRLKK